MQWLLVWGADYRGAPPSHGLQKGTTERVFPALSPKSPGIASIYVAVRIYFSRSLFLAHTYYWCCRCCLTPSRNFSEFRCVGRDILHAMPHLCEMHEVSACRKASASAIFHAHTCTYHENWKKHSRTNARTLQTNTHARRIHTQTDYWHTYTHKQIIDTVPFGKTLVLDDHTQSSSLDEHIYHEVNCTHYLTSRIHTFIQSISHGVTKICWLKYHVSFAMQKCPTNWCLFWKKARQCVRLLQVSQTHIYTYIHTHIHTHTYTLIHTHTYTYIQINTHTYTYIHVHTHTYTQDRKSVV